MPGFERLTRCLDLTEADIDRAITSSAETKELVSRLVSVARPNEGAPKILLLFARIAAVRPDWLDGDLYLDVNGDEKRTTISVLTELGGGLRERLLPTFTVKVPVSEFARALERHPHVVQPLVVDVKGPTRLVMTTRPQEVPPEPPQVALELQEVAPDSRSDVAATTRSTVPPPFDMGDFARKRTGPAPVAGELPTMRPPTLTGRGNFAYLGEASLLTEAELLQKLGSLERVPRVIAERDDIRALSMDRSMAFVLSQIDGVSTLEMIVDVSGMPRLDALRILFALLAQDAIETR